jgi:hypothetical protein
MLALGMDTTLQIRRSVEQNIRTAFRGVTFGAGISLQTPCTNQYWKYITLIWSTNNTVAAAGPFQPSLM